MSPPIRPHRRIFCLFATAAAGALATSVSAAIDVAAWKYRQSVELAAPGLVKIPLPAETLDLARADLADLRVLGPAGDEVPYALELPAPPAVRHASPRSFNVRLQKTTTELTLETGVTTPLAALELLTPAANFLKAARLEISSDGRRWETVADGVPFARQPGVDDTTLPLPHLAAAFLRITLDDERSGPITFQGAVLFLAAAAPADRIPVETTIARRDEFVHESVVTVDLKARHLPLVDFEFTVADPLFSRRVTVTARQLRDGELVGRPLARGAISRMQFVADGASDSLRLPLALTTDTRRLEIHIANGDNAPLALREIRAHRRPVWLTLHAAAAGTYTLLTGHARATRPAYDLAGFTDELARLPVSSLPVAPAVPNPAYQKPDSLAAAPLLGAPLEVSAWKFHRPISVTADGAQEVELDLAVLAHARPDLGDLRLMREGRQVPFLLERTSARRPIPLSPLAVDDPTAPRTSRWKLSLPFAALPVQGLTLTSPTALFSRRLVVYEILSDSGGRSAQAPFERPLADAVVWSTTPAAPRTRFTLSLWVAPQTDTLYLTTDNGDNPAITLGPVQAEYRVTRLLFRAAAGAVELHYGANVTAPRYDLELVANELIQDEKNSALLGAEVSAAAAPSAQNWLGQLRGGALLWTALTLVVVVLLAVIARLLPKPPAS